MAERRLTVGLVQMAMSPERDANLARAQTLIAQAAANGAQLICLPELFLTPYFCQVESAELFALAEPVPGPTTEALGGLAAQLGVYLIVPLFERRGAGVYHNTAVVLDPRGTIAARYRKMHIPHDPGYYEKYYFAPGDLGFPVVTAEWGRFGVLICWDQWFPEAARLLTLAGAEMIFYPTAIGWHPGEKPQHGVAQLEAWLTVQRGHAIANGVFVAAVNRVGHERPTIGSGEGLEFWGNSFLVGPFGQIIRQAPADEQTLLIAAVNLDEIEITRRSWPFLRDRRVDAYGPLLERWKE